MAIGWKSQIQQWDDRLFAHLFIGSEGKNFRRKMFYALSRSADGPLYLLLIPTLFLLMPQAAPQMICAGLLAFFLDLSIYHLVKKKACRPRPFQKLAGVEYLIAPPDEFSFPSGHTAAAFLVAVLLSISFPALSVIAMAWASLVGLSRIYLGVHYPTDVLAGMILGISSAIFSSWVFGIL